MCLLARGGGPRLGLRYSSEALLFHGFPHGHWKWVLQELQLQLQQKLQLQLQQKHQLEPELPLAQGQQYQNSCDMGGRQENK